ncbi:SPOR domain-containing protein [Rubrimonas cliftonensis]|uniref:SPOR domain-containing protein n=1 Tax=Rubrimonas cliftonensis TaxID=89524 RepID=A0A1H3YXE6_9RHOB|nr:hypothetical protein [Rubrimonas cliftonensis]SEA16110.1 hypothetical protein SAMN05444370_103288 [Rubrimonas cliftonensis]
MTRWWVAETPSRARGRGHVDGCGWGPGGLSGALVGREPVVWHGPFENRRDADNTLRRLRNRGWEDVRWCAACAGEEEPC